MPMNYNDCWTYPKSKIDELLKALELPTAPESNGTYVLTMTVSSGTATLTWESSNT